VRILDNDIKDILVKLLDGQSKLEHEIIDIKTEIIELKAIIKKNSRGGFLF